jgi:hypothetical protein
LLGGIYEIVPRSVLGILNERELEYVMCGCEIIDINAQEWKQCVIYDSYKAKENIIVWLWEIISDFSTVERNLLLQHVTDAQLVSSWNLSKLVPYIMIARSNDADNPIKFIPKVNRVDIWDGFSSKDHMLVMLRRAIGA